MSAEELQKLIRRTWTSAYRQYLTFAGLDSGKEAENDGVADIEIKIETGGLEFGRSALSTRRVQVHVSEPERVEEVVNQERQDEDHDPCRVKTPCGTATRRSNGSTRAA
jgi:hypothetical protein